MKPDDLSELKGKIEGLKKRAGELDTRIGGPDREIDRSKRQQGERKGDIVNKLRGDGSVGEEWEEARKHEDPKPPSSGGSSLQVVWLRESYGSANFANPQNPLNIHEHAPGKKEIIDRIRTFSYSVSPQRELRREVPQGSLYAKPSGNRDLPTYYLGERPCVRGPSGFRRMQIKIRDR